MGFRSRLRSVFSGGGFQGLPMPPLPPGLPMPPGLGGQMGMGGQMGGGGIMGGGMMSYGQPQQGGLGPGMNLEGLVQMVGGSQNQTQMNLTGGGLI